jgi:hypothetical protein
MVIIQVPRRCNVTHKPDLRTADYVPELPPICHLPSPFLSVTITASVYVTSAITVILYVAAAFTIFTVSATVFIAFTATAIFTTTAATSV